MEFGEMTANTTKWRQELNGEKGPNDVHITPKYILGSRGNLCPLLNRT